MKRYIQSTMRPAAYHGHGKQAPFFEGWYFKIVDASQQQTWAIIPGIYMGVEPDQTQAFVMVLDGRTHEVAFHTYPATAFNASQRDFLVQIGPNVFSDRFLTLNLPGLSGHLRFENVVSWPITVRSPGIMGWYAWVPIMECYHGLVSLDHVLHGTLTADNSEIAFDGGRGYIEKDWGRNFPQTWIWIQSNHFETPGSCLTASVARIPWFGTEFPGFIIGLWHAGVLHRFTTYVGATIDEIAVTDETVSIVTRNRTHRLTITAQRAPTALLYGPKPGQGMVPFVQESLAAAVYVQLSRLDGTIVWEGAGRNAGLELQGDLRKLMPR
jgi:hypothetical protein